MIVAFTLPAMGHIKPMMPLLSGLIGRGQRVVCFGHTAFKSVIRSSGAEFAPYPDIPYKIDTPDFNLLQMAADLIRASETFYPKLLQDVATLSPQLIVQDFMALWASRIGTALNIPRVHTIPTLVFNSETERRMRKEDGIAKLTRDIFYGAPPLIRAMIASKFTISARVSFGLERSWRSLSAPLCELVFCFEELQVGDRQGDVPRHYIGPTIDEQSHYEPPPYPPGYALITFGTLSNSQTGRFEAALRGAILAGFSAVALCGTKVDLPHLKSVARSLSATHPGQSATVLEHVPAVEALIGDAGVVIHHAGMATTWETACYYKPALFIPTIADQKVLASQLENHGFGIRLPRGREFDPRAIAQSIQSVRTLTYPQAKFREMRAKAGGTAAGLDIILNILKRQP